MESSRQLYLALSLYLVKIGGYQVPVIEIFPTCGITIVNAISQVAAS
jgi:hypothetical protein